jgi:hypothetical protein
LSPRVLEIYQVTCWRRHNKLIELGHHFVKEQAFKAFTERKISALERAIPIYERTEPDFSPLRFSRIQARREPEEFLQIFFGRTMQSDKFNQFV